MRRWPLWTALALAALFAFERISDMDAGWLLALGREIARTGHVTSTNAISWTAPGQPWYPTNWLFDLGLYGAHRAAGVFGVQVLTFALSALTLLVVNRAARRAGAGEAAADAATLLAVGVFWTRITPRPHLVEYLFEAVILERALAGRLLVLPLVIAVWANAHQSAPFGLAAAALAMRWDRRNVILLGVSALALLATPGFDANLRDLFAHLTIGETLPILEHQRPTPLSDPAIYLLAIAIAAAALWSRSRVALPALLFTAMTFVLGRRFGGDMAVLGIVPLALTATGLLTKSKLLTKSEELSKGKLAGLGGLAGCLALLVLGHVPVTSLGAFVGTSWDANALPVEAVEFAKSQRLGDRGFHAFRFGGYVAFQLAPDFQDGRVRAWPPQFWRDERAAMQSPGEFAAWLDRLGAGWALVASNPSPMSGYSLLDGNPGWNRLHKDDVAEVWVRVR